VSGLKLNEILASVDMNAKHIWDELTEEQRKSIVFFTLNRYISVIQGSREKQELAVFKTNEYYNKNWNVLGMKHPKLQWQLLCQAGNTGKIEYHPWIGFKKKGTTTNNGTKLLERIYPNMKQDEIELLASQYTKKELKQLAEEHSIDIKL